MSLNVKHLMTVADLEALPYDETHRYELIEGELHVSPAPLVPHQLVLHNLQLELGIYLRQHAVGTVVPGPNAIFSDYDWVIPDIVFVRKDRWDGILDRGSFYGAPDLMIEILSPGSTNRTRDLKLKRKQYGKFGVQEYWVVDVQAQSLMIFRLEGDTLQEIKTIRDDDRLESPLLPDFSIRVGEIFS